IIPKIALLFLLGITSASNAQTMTACAGTIATLTAINSASLSNPTYSLNPGAITSGSPNFTVSAPTGTVLYTLYVTGTNSNSAVVTTTSNTTVIWSEPTYNLVSPQNFSLGCASTSVCVLNITNASTSPFPGG